MPWRIRAPATAFLLTPKASAMRDIGMPSAESSRSLVIAGSSQVMCQVGQFVGRRGASFGYPSVLLSSLIVHKSMLCAKRPQKIVKCFGDFQHHPVGQSNEAGVAVSACRLDMHYVRGIDRDIDGAIDLDAI